MAFSLLTPEGPARLAPFRSLPRTGGASRLAAALFTAGLAACSGEAEGGSGAGGAGGETSAASDAASTGVTGSGGGTTGAGSPAASVGSGPQTSTTSASGGPATSGSTGNGCGDLQNDPANCGACGNACALGQTCVNGACVCAGGGASFSADVLPLLKASCAKAGCHAGGNPKAGLDLTAAAAHGELVGVPASQCKDGRLRVKAGDPAASYVLHKLTNTNVCFGNEMPPSGFFAESSIERIAAWICAGAPND